MSFKISNQNIIFNTRTSKIENTIFLNILNKVNNDLKETIILESKEFKKLDSQDIIEALNGLMTKYISYSFIDEYDKNTFSQFPHVSYFSKIDDFFYITIPPMIVNAFKKNSIESFLSLKTFFYFRQKSSHNFFNLVLKNSSENINLVLSIEELKNIFNVKEDAYDRFFDFEKALLKPLVENINSYSNYTLIYNKIKKGESKNNKVTAIEFILKNNSLIEKSAETNYLIKSNIEDYKNI